MSWLETEGFRATEGGTLELAHVAGDIELGPLVVVEAQHPADGEVVFVVPPGRSFVGSVSIVVAVGEIGQLALVDADEEAVASVALAGPLSEPMVSHVDVEVAKGQLRVANSGVRGLVLLRGRLR